MEPHLSPVGQLEKKKTEIKVKEQKLVEQKSIATGNNNIPDLPVKPDENLSFEEDNEMNSHEFDDDEGYDEIEQQQANNMSSGLRVARTLKLNIINNKDGTIQL